MPRKRRQLKRWLRISRLRISRLRINWPFLLASLATIVSLGLLVVLRSLGRASYWEVSDVEWQLAVVASCSEAVVAAWMIATGATIGSFLNVAAWRVPRGVSLLTPSRCPYCTTNLALWDNFPIFGWLRLRGRCSTCHLPIHPRYLCVELLLAAVFGWTFFNEYLSLGANLPTQPFQQMMSLEDRLLETTFGFQIFLYLWVTSGLIAVALMTLQKSVVPWSVFAWTIVPCLILPILAPDMIQVPWQSAVVDFAVVDYAVADYAEVDYAVADSIGQQRIAAGITIACGMALGMVVGKLLWIVANKIRRFTLTGSQFAEPTIDHQRTVLAGFAVAGGLLGWQAVVVVAMITLALSSLASAILTSRLLPKSLLVWRNNIGFIANWSSWIWLAVLIYRSTWIYWFRLVSQ